MSSSWFRLFLNSAFVVALSYLAYRKFFDSTHSQNINILKEDTKNIFSSVSCRGQNHTNRQCLFKNLCYDSKSENFIFFHSSASIITGVPEDRFSQALTDFSSVYDHNTQYFNYIDLPHSSISEFNISFASGVSLIFKRFNPENLMHVFHDDLIPAFTTLNELFFLHSNDVQFVFADNRQPGNYSELYNNFLTKQPIYLTSLNEFICFEKAIVGLSKESLWYQYGFKTSQGPIKTNNFPIYPILEQFRNYFYKQFLLNLEEPKTEETALLLTRKHNRKILNPGEVVKFTEMRTGMKTTLLNLEDFSLFDIIKNIKTSKLIISMHGSLLILTIFLPHDSYVIELFPYGVKPDICTPYKTLASIPGLDITYQAYRTNDKKNSIPHPEYPAELGGILHFSEDKQEMIKKSFVQPFLCCYNPEWLYRIYQDTIIDLESLDKLFNNIVRNIEETNKNIIKHQKLYPSEVQNISCTLLSFNTFSISWKEPWNVRFINFSSIEYELWYQDYERSDVKAFITKKTYIIFKENITDAYIWIRCHIDGKIGPFNTNPLICSKLL